MTAEFIGYTPTPSEKYLGIATVKIYGKVLLRYKVIPRNDGTSIFFAPPSIRLPAVDGADYVPSFILDSQIDEEEIFALIRRNIKQSEQRTPNIDAPASYRHQPLPTSTYDEVPF